MKKLLTLLVIAMPSIAAAQPGGMYSQPEPPMAFHNGLTFEANLGFGAMWSRVERSSSGGTSVDESDSYASLGANLGIGGFIAPNLAITARMATVNYTQDVNDGAGGTDTLSAIFFGPSVQYWINPNLWIGGGIGYAIAHRSYQNDFGETGDSTNDPTGLALDLRVGYTFWKQARNSLNVSFEYTPGFYGEDDYGALGRVSYQLNGMAVLFGYQYL